MTPVHPGAPQVTPEDPEHNGSRRDPEDRHVVYDREHKEKSLDKTLADSFPTSDPPSSIPDPSGSDAPLSEPQRRMLHDQLMAGLPAGSWAAFSIEDQTLVGHGATREEAEAKARAGGHGQLSLVQVGVSGDSGSDDDTAEIGGQSAA
jgi:hypothetical protein